MKAKMFSRAFAVNCSLHSYLIVSLPWWWFLLHKNVIARLIGTVLSGSVYCSGQL